MTTEDKIKKVMKKLAEVKAQQYEKMVERMKTMPPFKEVANIPEPPITDEKTYKEIVIPNFIRCGAIPKDKLEIDAKYLGNCRNTQEAVWDGQKFIYKRYKFGAYFNDTIPHFEDDDGYGNDLFVPIKKID